MLLQERNKFLATYAKLWTFLHKGAAFLNSCQEWKCCKVSKRSARSS